MESPAWSSGQGATVPSLLFGRLWFQGHQVSPLLPVAKAISEMIKWRFRNRLFNKCNIRRQNYFKSNLILFRGVEDTDKQNLAEKHFLKSLLRWMYGCYIFVFYNLINVFVFNVNKNV